MKTTHIKKIMCISGLILILAVPSLLQADISRVKFQAQGNYLLVEVLDDDLFHFEYGRGIGPGMDSAIETTDMACTPEDHMPAGVCTTNFSGPQHLSNTGEGVLETHDMRVEINRDNLGITILDKTKHNIHLTTITPLNLSQPFKGLSFSRTSELDVYGLDRHDRESARTYPSGVEVHTTPGRSESLQPPCNLAARE